MKAIDNSKEILELRNIASGIINALSKKIPQAMDAIESLKSKATEEDAIKLNKIDIEQYKQAIKDLSRAKEQLKNPLNGNSNK